MAIKHTITVGDVEDKVSAEIMQAGEIMKARINGSDRIILRTYDQWVDLEHPSATWTSLKAEGVIIPKGTVLKLVVG